MLCLLILVFNNLKSTTGLLSFVIFLVISITGEVWLVVFLDKIPSETNLCICQSIMGLSSSLMGKGLTKNGVSSITSMSTLILGHSPISSLRLKAFLYFRIISSVQLFLLHPKCSQSGQCISTRSLHQSCFFLDPCYLARDRDQLI